MIKICLIAAFPPSIRPLNEYSLHLAREIVRHTEVELTILADEIDDYQFATDAEGNPADAEQAWQVPEVTVIRCWKFGSLSTPLRLLNTIRQLKPDVVWFNLVFSTFGSLDHPLAAFAGLSVPALTRAAGFYTHITLHHITEHLDFASIGVSREKFYRKGTDVATRALLKAHSVSVLLSDYRRTLRTKYSAQNILVGTHGTFATIPRPPDLTKRGNPDLRILAFGNWGTYKRLERLVEAFPSVLERIPNARLIVAGGNHPAAVGYWESIREMQPLDLPIEFLGYVPQKDVPKLFRTSSVLVMPYDSSTGSSGPAHQACEYGVPIVCADISDFRCMAMDDDMSIIFYKVGDAGDLAEKLLSVLESPELQRQMSEHNYQAGVQMTMATVARNYLRWFELHRVKRTIAGKGTIARLRRRWLDSWSLRFDNSANCWNQEANFASKGADDEVSPMAVNSANMMLPSSGLVNPQPQLNPRTGIENLES
jgi:glycosyltransferase involved in cell wall biosynthesis